MSECSIIIIHSWSDPTASFERLAGFLCEKLNNTFTQMEQALAELGAGWDRWYKLLTAKRRALRSQAKDLPYTQKLKQRRGCYSGHRQVTL